MRNILLLLSFVFIVCSCQNDKTESSRIISLIPQNSSIVIKTNSVEGLNSAIKNNSLFKELSDYSQIKDLEQKLQYIKHLKPTENLLIAVGKDSKDSLQISIIAKYHKGLFSVDSIPNHSVETLTSGEVDITKTTLNKTIIYSRVKDSLFFASNDKALVETAFNEHSIDEDLAKIYHTANGDASLSVLVNLKINGFKPALFISPELSTLSLSNYLLVDADVSQDQILLNGITKAVDSSKSLINVFKNTIPQEIQTSKVCPPDADNFLSFTFNNYKTFNDNLLRFKKKDSVNTSSIFDLASEIGIIHKSRDEAVVLHSIDALATEDELLSQNALETYRETDIYPYDNPELFSISFSPFITFQKASKYIKLEDFFVFSDNIEFLKEIISSYQNTATLSETSTYQNIMEHLSDEASLFAYVNASSLNSIINSNFSEDKTLKIDQYKASAIQFIYDTDFAHVNAVIKKNKSKRTANSVSEDVSVALDADLLTNPQFVNNHTNNQKEVVVQDINNDLYLISNNGKVLWKKRLDGKVLGKIEQMDIYKNGRLQLVFATPKRVYVLDRNGKDVGPFPLKFSDAITQPLSLFDYDHKKNYRLLVTQGKNLLMYDKHGEIVTGFTYKSAESSINSQPQHFRIGRKDYIVFIQGSELEILDRVGKTRIKVKNNISFSDNDIYLYNNKFTATTNKGDLIQIDQNGKMSSANLNLGEKHAFTTTSKTLVTLSENQLTIKSKKVELDFGDYTAPKIFYLNDKIYVSVTDLQTNKVYLFDSLGKPIDNFPVYGNSAMELDNIDKGNGLEFVTKGDNNSIIIYQLN